MTIVKSRSKPQDTILQVYNGNHTTGIVASSGGHESIEYVDHDLSSLGSGDCGGPMILSRDMWYPQYGKCFAGPGQGSTICLHVAFGPDDPQQPLNSTLYGLGATAIARSLPTNPSVDGADIIAQSIQIREAVPKAIGSHIWREKALSAKALGGEYLNVEFGWLPFVDDVKSVMRAVVSSHEALLDLKAGSSRKTRVGYTFPFSPDFSTDRGIVYTHSADSGVGFDAGDVTALHESGTKTWFNGCYNYVIPGVDQHLSTIQRYREYADHVLGMKPGVEEMWDAAPWSWAVDWAINVGDIAHNIDAFHRDGLVLQYGYIMSHSYIRSMYSAPGGATCTGVSVTRTREWKVRFPASPYGFGLTWDGLTASQQLVLGSIGITHL